MKKPAAKDFLPADAEEKALIDASARGEYVPVTGSHLEQLKQTFKIAAQNTRAVRERQHISIKIPQDDLKLLKEEAERKGLRYQSLINSVLHQYVMGHLVEVR